MVARRCSAAPFVTTTQAVAFDKVEVDEILREVRAADHREFDTVGKGKSVISQKAGDVTWKAGGFSHTLKNTGTQPVRWVTVEVK